MDAPKRSPAEDSTSKAPAGRKEGAMNNPTAPAMTDREIVEKLARNVMGWSVSPDGKRYRRDLTDL
jgi:hypothetical protein